MTLLPANIDLAGAEAMLLMRAGREYALKRALAKVGGDFDVVIIDCPPSLGVLTLNGLTAADDVIVPLQCETLAHRGVGQFLRTITDVQQITNADSKLLGALPTLYDSRTTHSRDVLLDVADRYELPVLAPPIPRTVRFAEASASGSSVMAGRKNKGAHGLSGAGDRAAQALEVGQGAADVRARGLVRPSATAVSPRCSSSVEPATSGTTADFDGCALQRDEAFAGAGRRVVDAEAVGDRDQQLARPSSSPGRPEHARRPGRRCTGTAAAGVEDQHASPVHQVIRSPARGSRRPRGDTGSAAQVGGRRAGVVDDVDDGLRRRKVDGGGGVGDRDHPCVGVGLDPGSWTYLVGGVFLVGGTQQGQPQVGLVGAGLEHRHRGRTGRRGHQPAQQRAGHVGFDPGVEGAVADHPDHVGAPQLEPAVAGREHRGAVRGQRDLGSA